MNAFRTSLFVLGFSVSLAACKAKPSIVASVVGRDVTQNEFDAYLKLKHVAASDAKRRAAALDEYLDRTATAAILEKEGKLDKSAIDAEVDEFRKELVISRYFDQFLAEQVSEAAIKNYYDGHAAAYEQRKVHVAHILVRTQPNMSDAEKQAKRTTAQEVYSKLQAGQSFEELAKSASEDRISGAKGGDLGWLREGAIDPEFSKRAFAGKAGSIGEPFQTAFGFHILKVIEEPTVSRKPFAAAMGDIRYQLRSEVKAAEIKRLKQLANIKIIGDSQTNVQPAASVIGAPQALPVSNQPKLLTPTVGPQDPPLGIAQPNSQPPIVQPGSATPSPDTGRAESHAIVAPGSGAKGLPGTGKQLAAKTRVVAPKPPLGKTGPAPAAAAEKAPE